MVSLAMRPGTGCVGAKLYYPGDKIQHAGVIIGLGGVAGHSHKNFDRKARGYFGRLMVVQNVTAVTAACLVVKKAIYEEVGGLDEANLKVAFNDVDFCLKVAAAGYRNCWTPFAELYHHESISRGAEDDPVKRARFKSEVLFMKSKWGGALVRDPHYSPNLTLKYEDYSINVD
jgi:GT2 family glycosyltransferase